MLRKIRKMLQQQEGFTLVELIIVVVILGILAGVGIQQYGAVQERARRSVNQANIKMIANAVRMHQVMEGDDPTIENPFDWTQLSDHGLEDVPDSPWPDTNYTVTTGTGGRIAISNTYEAAAGDNVTISSVISNVDDDEDVDDDE